MRNEIEILKAAYSKVASLVIEDPAYLPIFERIEWEIAMCQNRDDIIQRAKAVASRYRATA
nr:hypothetical protein [uncultured Roseovarius sp.]